MGWKKKKFSGSLPTRSRTHATATAHVSESGMANHPFTIESAWTLVNPRQAREARAVHHSHPPMINMRFSVAVMLVAVLSAILPGKGAPRPASESAARQVTIYDDDTGHVWNRLHATFFVREDLLGTELLPDALDPPYWYHTSYLLAQPSHKKALSVLDEFLQTHGDNLIHDPVKRALLQRDLWAVFDWSAGRAPGYEAERRELQVRLAEALRRLALTPEEIRGASRQLRAGGRFGRVRKGIRSAAQRSRIPSA